MFFFSSILIVLQTFKRILLERCQSEFTTKFSKLTQLLKSTPPPPDDEVAVLRKEALGLVLFVGEVCRPVPHLASEVDSFSFLAFSISFHSSLPWVGGDAPKIGMAFQPLSRQGHQAMYDFPVAKPTHPSRPMKIETNFFLQQQRCNLIVIRGDIHIFIC